MKTNNINTIFFFFLFSYVMQEKLHAWRVNSTLNFTWKTDIAGIAKQGSKQKVIFQLLRKFCFHLTHTINSFDRLYISLVFVICSWFRERCFSVSIEYLWYNSLAFYVRRVYTFHKLSGPTVKLRLLNDCKYMKSYMRTAVLEMNLEAIFEVLNTT